MDLGDEQPTQHEIGRRTYIVAQVEPLDVDGVRTTEVGTALWLLGFLGLAIPSFLLALILLYYVNRCFGVSIGGLYDPQYAGKPWTWASTAFCPPMASARNSEATPTWACSAASATAALSAAASRPSTAAPKARRAARLP